MDQLTQNDIIAAEQLSFEAFRDEVLKDYRLACMSREASLLGRKEVLTGKAKFGIFGDGKEVPQVAMAKFFRPGDFYAGYYRDQTFAFATGVASVQEFFAQLYSDPDPKNDPHSGGRQMNSHFATEFVDEKGELLDLVNRKNLSANLAPTAAQMPKALGLAYASKAFRNVESLKQFTELSSNGDEVCFCTIGDASTTEGHFWETINAASVLQVPLAIFVWDDGYGISVPRKYQTAKGSISEALKGFQKRDDTNGINVYRAKAWDYAGMCEVFEEGIRIARETHTPALFHVEEVTQPQGHSTSGSHERYKTPERLEWERQWDCIRKMREWIIANELAGEEELEEVETEMKKKVRVDRQNAWNNFLDPVRQKASRGVEIINDIIATAPEYAARLEPLAQQLARNKEPLRRDVMHTLSQVVWAVNNAKLTQPASRYFDELKKDNEELYGSHLYVSGEKSPLQVEEVKPEFSSEAPMVNGYEILNKYFDQLFSNNPRVMAFGEDVGQIGDVNQGFAGLQAKHGEERIFDTGIRELTIIGQGTGMALRGIRPIAEIQYIDYLLYGLQTLSDDVATLHFRTVGRQSAPVIIRTRGHRLEGIWHSGSPMGMIIHALRGLHVCVPRNMVQAAGMYNTLLDGNDPAIVIECLNGYRLKEKLPSNLSAIRTPLGIPEILKPGNDVTIVSYGSTLRILLEAATVLEQLGVSCEIIDVQTLLPFDIHHAILDSLKRTSRIVFVDEDVPGGASAYMFNEVMEKQGGYSWLDVSPRTITAKAHRPGYGSDGDYFSKPNLEQVVDVVQQMMRE